MSLKEILSLSSSFYSALTLSLIAGFLSSTLKIFTPMVLALVTAVIDGDIVDRVRNPKNNENITESKS